ncbi:MAG: hypothetical protein EOM20_04620 [Spartobacteria bacterium]|nr:hypothetical protein [Spartobacteria bacterium]
MMDQRDHVFSHFTPKTMVGSKHCGGLLRQCELTSLRPDGRAFFAIAGKRNTPALEVCACGVATVTTRVWCPMARKAVQKVSTERATPPTIGA